MALVQRRAGANRLRGAVLPAALAGDRYVAGSIDRGLSTGGRSDAVHDGTVSPRLSQGTRQPALGQGAPGGLVARGSGQALVARRDSQASAARSDRELSEPPAQWLGASPRIGSKASDTGGVVTP